MTSTVSKLMTTHVISAFERAGFKEIAVVMRTNGISALPVVDADHRVVGVVSAADLLLKIEDPGPGPARGREGDGGGAVRAKRGADTARDLMTAPAVTIAADAPVRDAAKLMHRHRVKRLPVVAADGRLVGILSRSDLLPVFFVRDERLRTMVAEEIVHGEFGLAGVEVGAEGGVVTLEGALPRRSDIPRLARAIRHAEGVVRVRCRLAYDEDDLDPTPARSGEAPTDQG